MHCSAPKHAPIPTTFTPLSGRSTAYRIETGCTSKTIHSAKCTPGYVNLQHLNHCQTVPRVYALRIVQPKLYLMMSPLQPTPLQLMTIQRPCHMIGWVCFATRLITRNNYTLGSCWPMGYYYTGSTFGHSRQGVEKLMHKPGFYRDGDAEGFPIRNVSSVDDQLLPGEELSEAIFCTNQRKINGLK